MRIAWFDCFSGISGDMTLGALVSAGWPAAEAESLPRRLGLEGVRVSVGQARRGPFAASRVEVEVEERRQPHRHLHHVLEILEHADLPAGARRRAAAVFHKLAEAEAEVHGSTVEKVHFHEVGMADALVDVAGSCLGIESLGIGRLYASPPKLGRGFTRSAHGVIPVPAPAAVLLLRGAPIEVGDISAELTTPTGAALLATLVDEWSAPPAFTLERVGIGAGGRDLPEQPNVLRLLIGEAAGAAGRRVAVLETSLDDENPQLVAALASALLAAGALDAMVIPTIMKKGRPGLMLVAIAEPHAAEGLARKILAESSSLGVRLRIEERIELERRLETVETPYGPIALKVARLPDGRERAVPEFESVRAAAERRGCALREVSEAAIAAWRQKIGQDP